MYRRGNRDSSQISVVYRFPHYSSFLFLQWTSQDKMFPHITEHPLIQRARRKQTLNETRLTKRPLLKRSLVKRPPRNVHSQNVPLQNVFTRNIPWRKVPQQNVLLDNVSRNVLKQTVHLRKRPLIKRHTNRPNTKSSLHEISPSVSTG